jgi:hypothetical protein
MVFTGPSPVDAGYCAESYSPWLTWPRRRSRQSSEASRGEVPALERGTRTFPPSHPYRPVFFAFPPTRSQSSGYVRHETAGQDPRRGARRREGVSPSPVRPSYRGLPCWQGGRPGRSPPWAYALASASPPAAAARVMGLWVRPIPRGGFAPPFPRSAPRVHPRDPFRVAQPSSPGSPQVGVRSKEGALQRRVECCTSQDIPPACSFPGRGGRWRPPVLTSGPGANREVGHW